MEPDQDPQHGSNEEFLQLVSREIIEKSAKDKPRGFMQPGTLITSFRQNGATYAAVHVDGDAYDTNTIIPSLIGQDAGPGTRVMIFFDPPHGAYVIGSMNECLGEQTIVFSHPGELTTSQSPPYQFTYDSVITEIVAISKIDCLATLFFNFYLNSIVEVSFELCGLRQSTGPLNISVEGNSDIIYVESLQDSNCEDITILVRYRTLCTGIESPGPVECGGGPM